jgi:hypothetical protein
LFLLTLCSLAVTADSSAFLVGITNGTVHLCDPKSGKQVSDFEAHEDSVCSVAFFPNDTAFATGKWREKGGGGRREEGGGRREEGGGRREEGRRGRRKKDKEGKEGRAEK